jgi:hypothetical protein
MPEAVYRMMRLLCALVVNVPLGTNLGLLQLLWMPVSGRLLTTRGAVLPVLGACGLSRRAVRRAWAALGSGGLEQRAAARAVGAAGGGANGAGSCTITAATSPSRWT